MILHPFPGTTCPAVKSLTIDVTRVTPQQLQLTYRLIGDMAALRIPAASTAPTATPNLWQHTCFELFLRTPGAAAYEEYNFSPSLHWDHYRFARYRQPITTAPKIAPTLTCQRTGAAELILYATVLLPTPDPLALGLAAVIEDAEGQLTYWALAHSGASPDFHAPGSFTLQL